MEFGRVMHLSRSVAEPSFFLLTCELHGEQQRRSTTSPMSSADVPLCVNLDAIELHLESPSQFNHRSKQRNAAYAMSRLRHLAVRRHDRTKLERDGLGDGWSET